MISFLRRMLSPAPKPLDEAAIYLRTQGRLARAFKRVLRMPRHRSALSPASIDLLHRDLERIIKHAERIGWLPSSVELGEKK